MNYSINIKKPAVLKNQNLVKLLLAQACSNVAANIIFFTVLNLLFIKSQSVAVTGMITALYFLPGVFLGVISGVVVDRVNKRKIFITTNLIQAGIVLLFLIIAQKPFLAFPLILFYSLFDEFFNPAVGALLPDIANKKYLGEINTIWLFITHGAIVFGSIGATLLLRTLDNYQIIFPLVSGLLILGLIPILLIPKKLTNHQNGFKEALTYLDIEQFLSDIKNGLDYIKNNKIILFPILFLASAQTVVATGIALTPVFATMLKINIVDTSLLVVSPSVIGAILGGAYVSQIIKKKTIRKKDLIQRGLIFSAVSLIILVIITYFTKPYFFSWFFFIVLGFFFISSIIPAQTLIQENSPITVRGRVYGTLNMLMSLASLAPLLLTISLTEILGIKSILILAAGIFIFAAYLLKRNEKKLFYHLNHQDEK